MFERLTSDARQVVVEAQSSANRLGHGYIGTEHLLLGLLAVGDGGAAAVLRDVGVDAPAVEHSVVGIVGRGAGGCDNDADALRVLGIDLDAVRAAAEASFGPGALERAGAALRSGSRSGRRRRRKGSVCGSRRGLRRRWRDTSAAEGGGGGGGGRVPFTPRAKKVLELSLREALALRHGSIGTEHILLGLAREGEGLAAEVLVLAGVDLGDLRRRVLSALDDAA